MKTIEDIQKAQEAGAYIIPSPEKLTVPKDRVIDENQSVKWNREECRRREEANHSNVTNWRKESGEKGALMRQEVAEAIASEYGLSPKVALTVESFVWEEHHSSLSDYFNQFSKYCQLATDILAK